MTTQHSEILFEKAQEYLPGGVNSPVRAFGAVGGCPRMIAKASGAYLTDADGNQYLDYVGSWGPMLLGHNHPAVKEAVIHAVENGLSFGAACEAEVHMAELLCSMVPSLGMVRMVNSGTEAVMSALRLARGVTGREKIIKFEGCYHGHSDAMLVRAGSGLMTSGIPSSAGVTAGCASDTLTAVYGRLDSVQTLFAENPGQIAAVILEPVAANMGVVVPSPDFLLGLRELCSKEQALLIFDEVITGFRLGTGGAQGCFGVTPDLTCFGKVIGAGMPVGAYGGRRELMEQVAPLGPVYQAGTLSGNPVAMAAGIAQLEILKDHPEIYVRLDQMGQQLRNGLRALLEKYQIAGTVNGIGSLSCLFFTQGPVTDYLSAQQSDTARYAQFFHHMLSQEIYFAPSQFEAIFLSCAHTSTEIDYTICCAENFLSQLR